MIILPRNMFISRKIWYLDADLLSSVDSEIRPSNLDMNIRIVGRMVRKIFRAIPGSNPWITDLIIGLETKS